MKHFIFLIIVYAQSFYSYSQDSTFLQLPSNYLTKITEKINELESKLDNKTDKALEAFEKQEEKIRRKLSKIDSLKAKELFSSTREKYNALKQKLEIPQKFRGYIPYLDTLKTSFKFLEQNKQLLGNVKDAEKKYNDALGKIKGLENQLQKAEEIKKFIKERKQFLKEQLRKLGFAKQLKKLNKQVYYYTQQVNEYKDMLKDRKKIEKKAMELLSKTKLFQDFMKKNSMLASMFRLPGDLNDPSAQASLAGLQTRAQVNQLIQQQIGIGGPNAMQQVRQNMQQAQTQLSQLKDKLKSYESGNYGNGDVETPDFKPNSQKTKSFRKRIEYGANIQSQKASSIFPVTSDIGLSLGYKINDKSIIGIGAAYKVGWGNGWRHIKISHQGLGIRSFVDLKMKGSLYISGGYEQNYKTEIRNIDQLKDYSAWQSSGLIGFSKKYKVGKKLKGNMQLLWDFLSYQQIPRAQPILFRTGYSLK